ncbi:MAG TPA: hypothetical protein VF752_06455 [Thermoleophilaceae bacterium]
MRFLRERHARFVLAVDLRPAARIALVAAATALALMAVGAGRAAASTSAAESQARALVAQNAAHGQRAQQSAKKKKKKKKLCVVKKLVNGKLRTVYIRTYAYRYKKKGGKKVRTIVRVKKAMRAACTKHCVKQVTKNGKVRTVYVTRKVTVLVKKGNKLVKRKRKMRMPALAKCPSTSGETVVGTPIKIKLIPGNPDTGSGSFARLDFGSFQRDAALSGEITGFSPGRIDISKPVDFTLTGGAINLAPTGIFIDDECFGEVSSAIRTGPGTNITLNKARENSGNLDPDANVVTSVINVKIRASLELRNDVDGCHKPYLPTGYTDTNARFLLRGALDSSGGLRVRLASTSVLLEDFTACLALGPANLPCNGFAAPLPFLVSNKVLASLEFGNYGKIKVS